MKKSIPAIAAAVAVAFSTGCSTVLPVSSHQARAKEDALRVAVFSANAEGKSDALSAAVGRAARMALADKGFRVEETENPDVRVSLGVSHREVNRAGDFVLMEGEVAARATVPSRENRSLGEERFKERGARALGESAALDELSKALEPKVAEWTARTVSADAAGIRAETVVVSYADASARRVPEFKTKFVAAVVGTPGVRSCSLVSESAAPPVAEYRVVYDGGAFPAGLVNEIAVRNPDLNLRPGVPF